MHRVLIALSLAILPLAAFADVYRSVDAQGHVQYSDTYSPGATLISTSGDTSATDTSSDAQKSASQTLKQGQQVSDQLAHDAAARQVAQDKADAQAQQCKQATDAYNNAVQSRRLYTMGADGQRQFMTDDEADAQRVSLREAMDAACKDADSQ